MICLDCEKFSKNEEAAQKLIKLIESKALIEVCNKATIPASLQIDAIKAAAKEFTGKKSLTGVSKHQEKILEQWKETFSNRISLGLSFRKHIGKAFPEFLNPSADFDCAAIDGFVELCKKCDPLNQKLHKTLVMFELL